MDVKSRNVKKFANFSNFLAHPVETPWTILTVLNRNVRRSVPYILNHIWQRRKNRNGSCPMHEWNHPLFFEFVTPPIPAPRADGPQRGGGTSADIVPIWIKFGVDSSTRCWDIAKKSPKCKNSPLTPIVTKISFPPFSARRGPPTPKRGENTPGARVRRHAKFGLNRPAGCGEIVDKKANKKNRKKHTVKKYLALHSNERMAGNKTGHRDTSHVINYSITFRITIRSRKGRFYAKSTRHVSL